MRPVPYRFSGPVHAGLIPLLAIAALLLAGCGYAGEPKAPALRRPEKVTDLGAVEHGSKIVVTFTIPRETTEGLPITEPPDVELRIGAEPATWNQAAWEANSQPVPVPEGYFVPLVPLHAKKTRKARKQATAAKSTRRVKRTAKSASVLPEPVETVDIDASKYVGKTVVIGVRVHGPGGNNAGWSRLLSLQVEPVLPVPFDLKAVDARDAVHLQWTANAPAFRIFRKQPAETDWSQIGESTQPSFDDKSIEYGKTWQYYVMSVRQVGDSLQESDPSETFTFTPKDRFPPAVPTGLAAISGTKTIELVWDRVPDADLAGYRVYRDGKRIADGLLTPAYSDKDVVVGAKYTYRVSAVDRAGNESEQSEAVTLVME